MIIVLLTIFRAFGWLLIGWLCSGGLARIGISLTNGRSFRAAMSGEADVLRAFMRVIRGEEL